MKNVYLLSERRPEVIIKGFPQNESESLKIVKKHFKLKDCGTTKMCILSKKDDPFACNCFQKCRMHEKVLKLFI